MFDILRLNTHPRVVEGNRHTGGLPLRHYFEHTVTLGHRIHGVSSIDAQIQNYLLQLYAIRHDRRETRAQTSLHYNLSPQKIIVQYREDLLDQNINADCPFFLIASLEHRPDRVDDIARMMCRTDYPLQRFLGLVEIVLPF